MTDSVTILTTVGILALAASWFGVAALRRWAGRRLLDIPNERSLHTCPTPRGGGLAIVLVVLAGSWLVFPFMQTEIMPLQWLMFNIGALLIAGVSWLDDLRSLSTSVRLAVHLTGALLVCAAFGAWKEIILPGVGCLNLGVWGWLLTLLWIVGLTNAFNFMDGIDGIAGGQAAVAGLGWAIMGIALHQPFLSLLGILIAASTLGFLGHNWPPAKIFMGDVGSAFLGFAFAVLPVIAARADARFVLVGMLLTWPFVFDTAFTFACRLKKRENVFAAHRSHLYQRLVVSGFSHRTVTLLYIGLSVIGALMAVACVMNMHHAGALILTVIPMFAFGLLAFTFWCEHKRNI